ncbi:hypothetical protein GCM10027413_19910 [Conyzicola nivalis]|uniref:Uncharacterized protein n=1 Tax=Conyzicola nivalis TaxID=1477021 RepID=A0A916SDK8_9MICO|nr:hypothetical protein GCM10010979_06710 [Conyzicola nivalis]
MIVLGVGIRGMDTRMPVNLQAPPPRMVHDDYRNPIGPCDVADTDVLEIAPEVRPADRVAVYDFQKT